ALDRDRAVGGLLERGALDRERVLPRRGERSELVARASAEGTERAPELVRGAEEEPLGAERAYQGDGSLRPAAEGEHQRRLSAGARSARGGAARPTPPDCARAPPRRGLPGPCARAPRSAFAGAGESQRRGPADWRRRPAPLPPIRGASPPPRRGRCTPRGVRRRGSRRV